MRFSSLSLLRGGHDLRPTRNETYVCSQPRICRSNLCYSSTIHMHEAIDSNAKRMCTSVESAMITKKNSNCKLCRWKYVFLFFFSTLRFRNMESRVCNQNNLVFSLFSLSFILNGIQILCLCKSCVWTASISNKLLSLFFHFTLISTDSWHKSTKIKTKTNKPSQIVSYSLWKVEIINIFIEQIAKK